MATHVKEAQKEADLLVNRHTFKSQLRDVVKYRHMMLLLIPGIVYLVVFHYFPMYGLVLAFKDFEIEKGILMSPWAGLKHFRRLFMGDQLPKLIFNTVRISLLTTLFGFPAPIILAILLNELRSPGFKRTAQTILYFPHFLSWVFLGAVVIEILSPSSGLVGAFYRMIGRKAPYLMIDPGAFIPILIISGIWKSAGYGTVIYLASIAGINPELYESAMIDGAGRFRMAIHITLPSLLPVITILLILRMGGLLSVNFEQVFNLMNPLVLDVADVLDTYIVRIGLQGFQYEFATAISLFRALVGFFLVFITNLVAKRMSEYALW